MSNTPIRYGKWRRVNGRMVEESAGGEEPDLIDQIESEDVSAVQSATYEVDESDHNNSNVPED